MANSAPKLINHQQELASVREGSVEDIESIPLERPSSAEPFTIRSRRRSDSAQEIIGGNNSAPKMSNKSGEKRVSSELDLLESDIDEEQFCVEKVSTIDPSKLEKINLGNPEPETKNSQEDLEARQSPSSGPRSPKTEFPGFFGFFWNELTRGYALENDEARYTEKRKKVYAFIQIPRELERFLWYGFLQCTDAFLYFFTFLPLRFLISLFRLLMYPCIGKGLKPSEKCDIIKVFILLVASVMMQFVDTSFVYHLIRGQTVIKLYIFFNMLEVADKLFSSFGQDILDALFWTATEPFEGSKTGRFGTLGHLILGVSYVMIHTMLVLFQATTINVAFNSHNKALLTIMISNNFVELKGSVFKKFAKSNLFQMACSDVRERFHYLILLFIVIVRNMTAVNWKSEHFWEMLPDLILVLFGEFFIDWFKHAFITKFNEIPYEVYKDFTITIAYDVLKSRQANAFSDHSDQVSRRMGFIPLPLSVLLIRIVTQSMKIETRAGLMLFVLAYVALVTLKILNSVVLLGKATRYIDTYEKMQKQATLLERIRQTKAKSLPNSPRLSLIEFNDIMQMSHPITKGYTVSDILQHAAELAAVQLADERERGPLILRSKSVAALTSPGRTRKSSGLSGLGSPPQLDDSPAAIGRFEGVSMTTDSIGLHVETEDGVSTPGSTHSSPKKRVKIASECESLSQVDRYTLLNNDRIEM